MILCIEMPPIVVAKVVKFAAHLIYYGKGLQADGSYRYYVKAFFLLSYLGGRLYPLPIGYGLYNVKP